ncbi:hypothetical protein MATL_G00238910 [Megalops atlanticus]|uniref:Uncharacterized protein n=1 Tax=Megalops atlanticus TaxID=7932 RepID=A0A9D3PC41_MEGAT|nr:hypothetical protein MATL_G00238910 [Megalops atlanticus]
MDAGTVAPPSPTECVRLCRPLLPPAGTPPLKKQPRRHSWRDVLPLFMPLTLHQEEKEGVKKKSRRGR